MSANDQVAGVAKGLDAMVAGAGAIKERFDPADWHRTKVLPLLVFNFFFLRLLSDHPQSISPDLVHRFTSGLVHKAIVPDPVLVAVMVDTEPTEWQEMMTVAIRNDIMDVVDQLEAAGDVLARVLSRRERNAFLGAVVFFVMQGIPGTDEAQSRTTMTAAQDLAKVLDIDLEAALRSLRKSERDIGVF
jgi:hypothetical protein